MTEYADLDLVTAIIENRISIVDDNTANYVLANDIEGVRRNSARKSTLKNVLYLIRQLPKAADLSDRITWLEKQLNLAHDERVRSVDSWIRAWGEAHEHSEAEITRLKTLVAKYKPYYDVHYD